ncbi:RAD51-associated protein 1 isoform X2 [Entelurus aequoreus]|uniref:RAD51-associated protein 1 isoform X2 n=1 Tax=Entelurus aequoreus TaxID=161455 RepID=UPI002B1D82B6|nr:RAD51-associated protein 1 isoform X2 [Entelurus aequoreus]
MDRPSRKIKAVNYSESKEFNDDDDDFASVKPPPSKKPKEGLKLQECKKSSSQESNLQSPCQKVDRKPLDEKLLARDLEAAITLSLLNNTDGIPTGKGVKHHVKCYCLKKQIKLTLFFSGVVVPADENTDPAPLHRSNCSIDSSILGIDQISSEKEAGLRKAAQDEDDDYQPKPTPDSESEDAFSEAAESEDEEEFTVKKTKKTTTGKKEKSSRHSVSKKEPPKLKPQPRTAPSTPARSPPKRKLAAKMPTLTASVPKPAVSISPTGSKIPKWNPPGQIGKCPSSSQSPPVRSPGQGLRLGLSRFVRVKPLHPGVATT